MVGTILQDAQKLLTTAEPAELGPGPRAGILAEAELESKLDGLFDRGEIAVSRQPLIRALLLLWHDHLDAAHVIAQSIDNADGAFVHGIMHRREPDYGNAKYWFHRVGAHGSFSELAKRAQSFLVSKGDKRLAEELIKNGRWDAFAFVDACEAAAERRGGAGREALLRDVQAIESQVLLEWLVEGKV
jgi:hypothetical protein